MECSLPRVPVPVLGVSPLRPSARPRPNKAQSSPSADSRIDGCTSHPKPSEFSPYHHPVFDNSLLVSETSHLAPEPIAGHRCSGDAVVGHGPDMSQIAAVSSECLSSFDTLCAELSSLGAAPEEAQLTTVDGIKCEQGRFKAWCGSLGALDGQCSLDSRLRESTDVFSNVTRLLRELQAALSESECIYFRIEVM